MEADSLFVVDDADIEVSLRMRTGKDNDPVVFYRLSDRFTKERELVSRQDYNRLPAEEKVEPQEDQVDWSFWSSPFTTSGQAITLPSPRQFFQFEISMESKDILDGLRLTSVAVEHSIPPLAQALIGEVSVLDEPRPARGVAVVPSGEFATFVYDLIANVDRADVGFNAIRIFTPSSQPKFGELFVGNPPEKVEPTAVTEEVGSLTLEFPPTHRITDDDVVQVVFEAQVFVQGSVLNAEVFDTQSDEKPQRVLSGDANPEVTTNTLRVLTTAGSARDILSSFEIAPGVFSPNGDDVNDDALVGFSLLQLTNPVEVEVEIFDLGGRRVRTLTGEEGNGNHVREWDGRDNGGNLLPVGIYLVNVSVHADQESFVRTGTVGMAY